MRTLRRTIAVLPGRETFWHDNYPELPKLVSRCTSIKPQAVCTCGEYNLKWMGI